MTKRSNPFVEDFVPQSKTHVGLKQFNNNEDRMQKVYGKRALAYDLKKTLHLLFKGAKKSSEEVKIMDTVPPARKDCMKQLLINKDGTLIHSKIIVSFIMYAKNHIPFYYDSSHIIISGVQLRFQGYHLTQDTDNEVAGNHCRVQECACGGPPRPADTQCSYCEAPLCTACNRLCARCHLPFCSKCSLIGSEGTEICVSCYG